MKLDQIDGLRQTEAVRMRKFRALQEPISLPQDLLKFRPLTNWNWKKDKFMFFLHSFLDNNVPDM